MNLLAAALRSLLLKIYMRNYICFWVNDNGSEELLSVTGNEATAFVTSRGMRKQCMISFTRSQCGLSMSRIFSHHKWQPCSHRCWVRCPPNPISPADVLGQLDKPKEKAGQVLISSFYRWGKQGSEMVGIQPIITSKLIKEWGLGLRASPSWSQHSSHKYVPGGQGLVYFLLLRIWHVVGAQ